MEFLLSPLSYAAAGLVFIGRSYAASEMPFKIIGA